MTGWKHHAIMRLKNKLLFTEDGVKMKVIEVADRTPLLIKQLLEVWESSVRATHLFLSENEIENIKKYAASPERSTAFTRSKP